MIEIIVIVLSAVTLFVAVIPIIKNYIKDRRQIKINLGIMKNGRCPDCRKEKVMKKSRSCVDVPYKHYFCVDCGRDLSSLVKKLKKKKWYYESYFRDIGSTWK